MSLVIQMNLITMHKVFKGFLAPGIDVKLETQPTCISLILIKL